MTGLSEHQIQCQFMDQVRLFEERYPVLKLVFSVPNAGAGAQRGQAGKMKAEGVRAGVADVFVSVPRLKNTGEIRTPGYYLEFKRPKQKQRPEQVEFQRAVTAQGYAYSVVFSAEEAWMRLTSYLAPMVTLPSWDGQ